MNSRVLLLLFGISVLFFCGKCSKGGGGNGGGGGGGGTIPGTNDMEAWVTKGDQTALLEKQLATLSFTTTTNSFPDIDVDSTTSYQTVDGFGYTLTGSSAYLINRMGNNEKTALLNELFGTGGNSLGISYIRVSIGASDLSPSVF